MVWSVGKRLVTRECCQYVKAKAHRGRSNKEGGGDSNTFSTGTEKCPGKAARSLRCNGLISIRPIRIGPILLPSCCLLDGGLFKGRKNGRLGGGGVRFGGGLGVLGEGLGGGGGVGGF